MKKISIYVSLILSVTYIALFYFNVSDLVVKHQELEFSIPLYAILFSALITVVLLIIYKIKNIDKLYFLIPALFFISAIITMIIGYNTPCELCTL